jgi:DMSO/TMAO reductase YedYZ molybdopterin-dependent catalytic subunit
MPKQLILATLTLCVALGLREARGQAPAVESKAKTPSVAVRGDVAQPLNLRLEDLALMPRRSAKVKDHDGRESVVEGVLVADILKRAGVKQGKELRGELLATYLLVEAADGYRVVFSLPELDEVFTDRIVLLADRKDGKPLDDREGPLRIVVPEEKRPARWVRQVTALTIRRSANEPNSPGSAHR